jgi:hypothetical protein
MKILDFSTEGVNFYGTKIDLFFNMIPLQQKNKNKKTSRERISVPFS